LEDRYASQRNERKCPLLRDPFKHDKIDYRVRNSELGNTGMMTRGLGCDTKHGEAWQRRADPNRFGDMADEPRTQRYSMDHRELGK